MPAAFLATTTVSLAIAALATGQVVFEPQPPTSGSIIRARLVAVEGHGLAASIPLDLSTGQAPRHVEPLEAPRHGSYLSGSLARFRLPAGGGLFRLRLLPARDPGAEGHRLRGLRGDGAAGPDRGPRPVDRRGRSLARPLQPQRGRFLLCTGMESGSPGETELASSTEGGAPHRTLNCDPWPVEDAPPAAIPWSCRASSAPPTSWRFSRRRPASSTTFIRTALTLVALGEETAPETLGRFPVAGTFAVDTPPAIAFVDRQGAVEVLSQWGSWEEWSSPLEVTPGDDLIWPVSLPVAGADALAVISPAKGTLEILTAAGQRTSLVPFLGAADVRRPFGAGYQEDLAWAKLLHGGPAGFFLARGWWSSGNGQDPSPTTYPLKFPDDPPVTH